MHYKITGCGVGRISSRRWACGAPPVFGLKQKPDLLWVDRYLFSCIFFLLPGYLGATEFPIVFTDSNFFTGADIDNLAMVKKTFENMESLHDLTGVDSMCQAVAGKISGKEMRDGVERIDGLPVVMAKGLAAVLAEALEKIKK